MPQEENEPLIIAKWPFYLGDFLLVVTAIAIASLSEWNLTDWQVVACVLSVALGAALFVLPYLVEYYMRIQEESDDRVAQIRALNRKLDLVQNAVDEHGDQFAVISEKFASESRAYDFLANAVDQKVSVIDTQKEAMDRGFAGVADRFSLLEAKIIVNKDDKDADVESADASVISERLDRVQSETKIVRDELTVLREGLSALQAFVASSKVDAKPELSNECAEAPEKDQPRDGGKSSRPKRAARKNRKAASLLKRAIPSADVAELSAMGRIIGKPKGGEQPVPSDELAQSDRLNVSEPEEGKPGVDAEKETDASVDEKLEEAPKNVEPEARIPEEATDESMSASDVVSADTLDEMALSELEEFEMTMPEVEPFDEAAIEPKAGEEGEAVIEEPVSKPAAMDPVATAPAASGAVVTAHVLIGIGNKPYLRGSGGGLQWDTGVPMNFEEIGKWSWLMSKSIAEPIEFQIFRNDVDADRKGKHVLRPGEKIDVEPKF